MKDWIEYHYIFEDKELIEKLGLKGESISEIEKTTGKLKLITK